MIMVHRLKGEPMLLNADLITTIETNPDTVITLADGRRLVVSDVAAKHVIAVPAATFLIGLFFMSRTKVAPEADQDRSALLADLPAEWKALIGIGLAFMVSGLVIAGGQLASRSIVQNELGTETLGHFDAFVVVDRGIGEPGDEHCVGLDAHRAQGLHGDLHGPGVVRDLHRTAFLVDGDVDAGAGSRDLAANGGGHCLRQGDGGVVVRRPALGEEGAGVGHSIADDAAGDDHHVGRGFVVNASER